MIRESLFPRVFFEVDQILTSNVLWYKSQYLAELLLIYTGVTEQNLVWI